MTEHGGGEAGATGGDPLPLLISIPHGGRGCPPELDGRVILSEADLFDDGDAFADRIYDVGALAARLEIAEVARAFVDMNRAEDDLPPQNPDGVVKSVTCYGVPIYAKGAAPDLALVETLLERYHRPYHEALRTAVRETPLAAVLDCHTMAAHPPAIAPDSGAARPLFCLSDADGTTSPAEVTDALGDSLAAAFDVPREQVTRNHPFQGGWIVRSHGADARTDERVPWIQVEMNRSLYLTEPWFDRALLEVDPSRLEELRDRFSEALRVFAARIGTSTFAAGG